MVAVVEDEVVAPVGDGVLAGESDGVVGRAAAGPRRTLPPRDRTGGSRGGFFCPVAARVGTPFVVATPASINQCSD